MFFNSAVSAINSYFSWVMFSFIAPNVAWLLPCCSSLHVARCRWYWSFKQAFSEHNSDTCSSSSSILVLCISSNSCWVSIMLLSSFRYSAALVGFSVGLSISLRLWLTPPNSVLSKPVFNLRYGYAQLNSNPMCLFAPRHCFHVLFERARMKCAQCKTRSNGNN